MISFHDNVYVLICFLIFSFSLSETLKGDGLESYEKAVPAGLQDASISHY